VAKTTDSHIQSLFRQAGKNLPAIDQLASYLLQRRLPLKHALRAYKGYLVYKPGSANAAFNYAFYLGKDAQFEAAISMYQRALKLGIDAPEEVHLNIANIYMDQLRNDGKARVHLQKAMVKNPGYAGAYFNLGNLEEQAGDRDTAALNFEQCLKIDPTNESALARLADTHKFVEEDDPLLAKLVVATRGGKNSDLQFALGKAYEQLGNFEAAWRHFSSGNALDKKAFPPYRQEHTEAVFRQIMSQCNDEWFSRFKGSSHDPVFICGMFRTGSTLLEQVLAAHPSFTAGGESEFFPRLVARELSPTGCQRISSVPPGPGQHDFRKASFMEKSAQGSVAETAWPINPAN